MTMRAMALDSVPGTPSVTDVAAPSPAAGELLVGVAASSINGFDVATAAGMLQGMMEHRFPLVPGKDFAGVVVALGEGVEGYAVGDRVFGVVTKPFLGTGSLAELVTVPAGYAAKIPDGLSTTDAGVLGLAGTAAVDAVNAAGLAAGETVLVSGATGGVGALAVQYATARGTRVVATARPGQETDFVRGLTTTEVHVVDHTAELESQVRAIAPQGVDAVLHLAGDGGQLLGLLAAGGRLVSTLGFGQDAAGRPDVTVIAVMAIPRPRPSMCSRPTPRPGRSGCR